MGLVSHDLFAAVLMLQHPNATRGWIRQMACDMADVMAQPDGPPGRADSSRPFADEPRIYAEDEAEHEASRREAAPTTLPVPDSCRRLGYFVVGFTG